MTLCDQNTCLEQYEVEMFTTCNGLCHPIDIPCNGLCPDGTVICGEFCLSPDMVEQFVQCDGIILKI